MLFRSMGATLPDAFRFREGRTCWWCGRRVFYGRKGDPLQATREHVVPRSHGGSGAQSNIVVACAQCNTKRQSDTDWVPFHMLAGVTTKIPRRQWEHLDGVGRLPERVAWKKVPA